MKIGNKKVLCVFAHPDDESFGPGGTIAMLSSLGCEIHLMCATKGQLGANNGDDETSLVRERELLKAAEILGIHQVEFGDFEDGKLCNQQLGELEKFVSAKILKFRPDLIMTFDLSGVSGHLDHMAVASAVTKSFNQTKVAKSLYYYCLPIERTDKIDDYFVFFPDGRKRDEIDEVIDVSEWYETRIKAMKAHESQIGDAMRILEDEKDLEKIECFMVRR